MCVQAGVLKPREARVRILSNARTNPQSGSASQQVQDQRKKSADSRATAVRPRQSFGDPSRLPRQSYGDASRLPRQSFADASRPRQSFGDIADPSRPRKSLGLGAFDGGLLPPDSQSFLGTYTFKDVS